MREQIFSQKFYAKSRLWNLWDMIEFHAAEFVFILRMIEIMPQWIDEYGENILTKEDKSSFKKDMNELDKLLNKYGLRVSAVQSKRILKRLAKQNIMADKILKNQIHTLMDRIQDELSVQVFYSFDANESNYIINPHKDWAEIIKRFPDTIIDIEEMHKCLAFNRYAAAIYHSTQIIETGLIELGKFIEVADFKSGWTAVTKRLDKIVNKTEHKNRSSFEQENFSFLEQLLATVEALKNAWRNKIGHSQGRLYLMDAQFSAEIAEEIVFASRSLMRRLAIGLPVTSVP